jgi:hypothetical protein
VTASVQLLPLFYSASVQQAELIQLVLGLVDTETLGHDVVSFEDEDGGTAERELAIPFLPGMDDVIVDAAELRLRAVSTERTITGWSVVTTSGVDAGRVVKLDVPGRLATVTLDKPSGWPGPNSDAERMRVVVRPAEPEGSGFTFGPPIFATPSFSLASPLYDPVLGGMGVTEVAGGKLRLTFPDTAGSAWLIQFAKGDEATKLATLSLATTVRAVTVNAATRELTLVVPGEDGDPAGDVLLWSYPNAFLRDVGEQVVSFTPVAQKRLAARLGTAGGAPTLPVPLRFTSAAGGRVAVTARRLEAHYEVRPLPPEKERVELGGSWTSLPLSAPTGRRPDSGTARAAVRHLGRELNAGSTVPPRSLPGSGVRVDGERWAASRLTVLPVSDSELQKVDLASARVLVAADEDVEVAVELRADAAGTPGAPVVPPLVQQLPAGTSGWIELELPTPHAVEPGPLWVALRTTRGELHWYAEGAGEARISLDRGETWGNVDPLLIDAEAPLAQLYHVLPEPLPRPQLVVQLGEVLVAADLLTGAGRTGPREFVLERLELPSPVLDAIGAATGGGRVETVLSLFSAAVAELTLEGAALSYDPFSV